jgi:hypothetical protein
VVAELEGRVLIDALRYPPRRAQNTPLTEETVPPDRDGDVLRRGGFLVVGVGGRGAEGAQVPADDDLGLDDGFAREDDVLGADELVPAGDFVACVL